MVDRTELNINKFSRQTRSQYKRLMRIRLAAMAAWVLPTPLALMFGLDDKHLWMFFLFWLALSGGSYLYMKVNDVCPWCKQSFYAQIGMFATGFDYIFRVRCANCSEPIDKDIKRNGY